MGPITLFDKSFLQSLSLNESVWFDHFFITNVCPIFFIETLADLSKSFEDDRSPEDEVRIIADKYPELNSQPCAHHNDLSTSNLLGYEVPITGQIVMDRSRLVSIEGIPHAYSEMSPITKAFYRWHDEDFDIIEYLHAIEWRQHLSDVNLSEMPEYLKAWESFNKSCDSFLEAYSIAKSFIESKDAPFLRLEIIFLLLEVPKSAQPRIRERFAELGYPQLDNFAPYSAYLFSVIIFSILSLQSGLISPYDTNNLTDIAYLFYLPFSMIFVSKDRFHEKITPYFMRDDQTFVWGEDLKKSLKDVNLFYSLFSEDEKEKGIYKIAPYPPAHIGSYVAKLWDKYLPNWRKKIINKSDHKKKQNAMQKLNRLESASEFNYEKENFQLRDIQGIGRKIKVRKKKGDWFQVPKDIE